MLYEIIEAKAYPDHTVSLIWSDGVKGIVDFSLYLSRGELFADLQDPFYFTEEMRVLRGGIGIAWPNEVDFSADGLRRDAFPMEDTGEFEDLAGGPFVGAELNSPVSAVRL